MPELSAKFKLTLTLLGGLALVTVIYFSFLNPLKANLKAQHQETQKTQNDLTRLRLEVQSYQKAQVDYNRIGGRVDEINRLFPAKEDLVGLVEELEAAAIASDNTFSLSIIDASEAQADLKKPKEEKPYTLVPNLLNVQVIPYIFQLQGSYQSIISFLQTLEHQPFFSEIDSITLTSDQNKLSGGDQSRSTRTGKVNAEIRSSFYAEKPKASK